MKTTKGSVYDSPMKMPTDGEILNAIRNDFEAFVPPASSKEEILKNLPAEQMQVLKKKF